MYARHTSTHSRVNHVSFAAIEKRLSGLFDLDENVERRSRSTRWPAPPLGGAPRYRVFNAVLRCGSDGAAHVLRPGTVFRRRLGQHNQGAGVAQAKRVSSTLLAIVDTGDPHGLRAYFQDAKPLPQRIHHQRVGELFSDADCIQTWLGPPRVPPETCTAVAKIISQHHHQQHGACQSAPQDPPSSSPRERRRSSTSSSPRRALRPRPAMCLRSDRPSTTRLMYDKKGSPIIQSEQGAQPVSERKRLGPKKRKRGTRQSKRARTLGVDTRRHSTRSPRRRGGRSVGRRRRRSSTSSDDECSSSSSSSSNASTPSRYRRQGRAARGQAAEAAGRRPGSSAGAAPVSAGPDESFAKNTAQALLCMVGKTLDTLSKGRGDAAPIIPQAGGAGQQPSPFFLSCAPPPFFALLPPPCPPSFTGPPRLPPTAPFCSSCGAPSNLCGRGAYCTRCGQRKE